MSCADRTQILQALPSHTSPQAWEGRGLLAVLHTHQTLSHPRAFAPAVPSAWNVRLTLILEPLNPLYFSALVLYFHPWSTSASHRFYELRYCSLSAGIHWSDASCRCGLCFV